MKSLSQEKAEFLQVVAARIVPETTDLDAGELSRLLFALGLVEKGYKVVDYDKTNEIIQKNAYDNVLLNEGIVA